MYKPKSLRLKNIISFVDQPFNFRNSKAVILSGNNKDNPGQKVNGAGKSAFIEGIALAFDGKSIRDVKTKELIHNDCDSGEVELVLHNVETNKYFKIWRKIYANTKSGEYRSWIYEGEWQEDKEWQKSVEQSDMYSDANMFNAFVWSTIGVSRDDFFSFHLITSDDYIPFLKISDTKKKDVINRFSGANKVDVVFEPIEKDSKEAGEKILAIEKELLQNKTKQEVLSEQLIKEELEISEDKRNEIIAKKEQELYNYIEQADASGSIPLREEDLIPLRNKVKAANEAVDKFDDATPLEPLQDELEIAKLELETFEFSKDFEKEFNKLSDQKATYQQEISALRISIPLIKDQYKDTIQAIINEEQELKQNIDLAKEELAANEWFESDVNKKLLDSIECPKCQHHFNLKDKSFNYEEAKLKLPEVQQTISEYKALIQELTIQLNEGIQKKKDDVNTSITKAGDVIRQEIDLLNEKVDKIVVDESKLKEEQNEELRSKRLLSEAVGQAQEKIDDKVKELKAEKKKLMDYVQTCKDELQDDERSLKMHLEFIAVSEAEIEKLRGQEIDRSKIVDLEKQIEALVIKEEEINKRLDIQRKEKERIDAWEINFKNFKSHLANQSIKNIQDYTNLYLEAMGSDLSISIDGYKTLSNKKIKEQISTTVLRDGFDAGSYGKFSGGERGRIDISCILAMQELIQINSPKGGLDLLIADEILDQVDSIGLESIVNSLQPLGKTIMVVSQNEINASSENCITIQKENKVSKILN